jgi:twitching motility protein PilT
MAPSGASFDVDQAMARGFDFSYAVADRARFRCNLYGRLGTPGLVIRVIPTRPPTLEALDLPPVLAEIAHVRRGLTLMSGTTGSGKTSALAGLIEVLKNNYPIKILTIEDPVELVHAPRKAFISHAEVGRDMPSFEHGLRQARMRNSLLKPPRARCRRK